MSPTIEQTMRRAASVLAKPRRIDPALPIKVGVDLGTAFTVIVITDERGKPLAAANTFADVVRDGIVWDFAGAMEVVRDLKTHLEQVTGRTLSAGSVTIPPDVSLSDSRAHHYVLEGVGIECADVVDEPTAANAVLGVKNGAVVDVGGGTTGVAIIRDGEVIATTDEPSGGTHMSLVISGAFKIPFADAEARKVDVGQQQMLLPVVRPTMQKIASIVRDAIAGHGVEKIHMVGGTSAFYGFAEIMEQVTGVPSRVAPEPMLVTPLGVAQWARPIIEEGM
ncbi:ethanolamine utilization protein EutJ [Propionimicrobium sp. PCR01-08-3]|uniref:ethanolamine utilization protein EutJ n=1 Tax=Propionimicrobium sp. PCR01-08-3 TaxID=3052086 RepID=UPI00255CC29A|nr:ethanolamine utilization protein EutJ [Propionimicrobium sp. PCR01-08-3]WIY82127.1 ethanolamine utilization protein EutJ [Propionimicrobium sp. PCR01-08-3]